MVIAVRFHYIIRIIDRLAYSSPVTSARYNHAIKVERKARRLKSGKKVIALRA